MIFSREKLNLKVLLQSKNLRMYVGSVLFGLLILTMFVMESYSSYKSELRIAEVHAGNLTQVLEVHIGNSFNKIDLMLKELQDIFEKEKHFSGRSKAFNDLLLVHKKRLPEVLSIKVVNELGEFVGDDLGFLSNKTLADREYFKEMKKFPANQLMISKPVISKTSNKWVTVLARPMLTKSGVFRGIILATIPSDYFSEIFSKLNVGNRGSISLLDLDSYLYARKPMLNNLIGKKLILSIYTNQFLKSSENSIIFKNISAIDGYEKMYAARKLENSRFAVIIGLSVDEFLLTWKLRTITYFIFITFIFGIFSFFLINFLNSLKQIEEQRKQAIQSAKLSSLGEMASGIAHEINNPLTIISSYARSLKRTNKEGSDDSRINESADKIIQTVDRIARIIKGLRSFARDSFEDPIVPTSVKKIIDSTLELCHEKLKDHNIELRINSFDDLKIDCREVQITQVLVNLINNSKDAIQGIENKWIQINVLEIDNQVVIAVSDCGIKITNEVAEKIMQPFFTTKEIGKGVGLGLSISKGIIEGHKGTFYLDRQSKYNSFVIKVPKSMEVQSYLKAS